MVAERFPVEGSHVMMFARAVGDPNPIYHDEQHAATTEPGEIIAPPTFVQAAAQFDPEYPLRPKPGEPWHGSAKGPTGLSEPSSTDGEGGTQLHAEQRYVYHRHPRVGDVLHPVVREGESWTKQGRRGGTLKFTETVTEFRDQADELVVTATTVGVETERPASND